MSWVTSGGSISNGMKSTTSMFRNIPEDGFDDDFDQDIGLGSGIDDFSVDFDQVFSLDNGDDGVYGLLSGMRTMAGMLASPPAVKELTGFDGRLVSEVVAVSADGLRATHKDNSKRATRGVVFGNGPLREDCQGRASFLVRLGAMRPNISKTSLAIGFTTTNPSSLTPEELDRLEFADCLRHSVSFGYDGRKLRSASEPGLLQVVPGWNPAELRVGSQIGIVVENARRALFYVDGALICNVSFKESDHELWPFVDLMGSAQHVAMELGRR
jgi:hypothetical protein